jgi:hypothetical protein
MTPFRDIQTKTLFFFGTLAIALGSTLRVATERLGRANDATDFTFGVLVGIGIALMIAVAWRSGRRRRNHSQ